MGDSIRLRRILSRMAGSLLPAYLCIHGNDGNWVVDCAASTLESTWHDLIRSRGNVYLGKEKLPLACVKLGPTLLQSGRKKLI